MVKAAAEVLIDEIRSVIQFYEIAGEIPKERIAGIKERIKMIERILGTRK